MASKKALEEEERRVAEMKFDFNIMNSSDRNFRERAKYIPLRLTYEERKTLRLVNAAISVSDYTNVIDIPFKSKAKRQHAQLQQVVAFLSGLISSVNYEVGQSVLEDRNFAPYEKEIQKMLEIARRYKITNPEKMRSEYGKLIYLMQDALSETIKPLLGINVYKPIITVYSYLESVDCLEILDHPALEVATKEILADDSKSRHTIELEIKRKENAQKTIVRDHATNSLDADAIRLCMYSIGDNNSFLNSNKRPVSDCLGLLKKHFSSEKATQEGLLSINEGLNGARLSHSHAMQYAYVYQSLSLWEAILDDMFRLWYLSELDLLCEQSPYELRETGQGLQRVQSSPSVYRSMHEILARIKTQVGDWVGSSVIHLGDNNVPNALMFIDKYVQVARILGPLVSTLNNLTKASSENAGVKNYLSYYGGVEAVERLILQDFFRFGFDGSGGDNFFDAGSCIDGRLTSAWNWCSQLANKPYYPLFKLTGFLSFDGEFDK